MLACVILPIALTFLAGSPPTISITADRIVTDSLDTLYTLRISGSMSNRLMSVLIGVDQLNGDENLIFPATVRIKANKKWKFRIDEIEDSKFTAIFAQPAYKDLDSENNNDTILAFKVPPGVHTNIGSCYVTFRDARSLKYSTRIELNDETASNKNKY